MEVSWCYKSLVSFLKCMNSGIWGTDSGKARHLVTFNLSLFYLFTFLFTCLHWVLVVAFGVFDLHCSMRDLYLWQENTELPHVESSSPTRDQTQARLHPGTQSLSHWTTREVLLLHLF